MLLIVGIITLFVVLSLSLFVVRLATVALSMTGLSEQAASFQARSAFTGTGFTTSESEQVVNHPVRRRVITALMMLQSARFFGILISLILMIAGAAADLHQLYNLVWLAAAAAALLILTYSQNLEKLTKATMANALDRWTDLQIQDYARLLDLSGDYMVTEIKLDEDDWLDGKQIRDCNLRSEGLLILGITRDDGSYVGVPRPKTELHAGDRLVIYGRGEAVDDLDRREKGRSGDAAHEVAVSEQDRQMTEQVRAEQDYERERSAREEEQGKDEPG